MRSYIADLAGGTATVTVQCQDSGTLKRAIFSFLSAAVGKIELSLSAASAIGTAQPTSDVLARVNCSATAGNVVVDVPIAVKVKPFSLLYIHQTGAGNLGSVSLLPQ